MLIGWLFAGDSLWPKVACCRSSGSRRAPSTSAPSLPFGHSPPLTILAGASTASVQGYARAGGAKALGRHFRSFRALQALSSRDDGRKAAASGAQTPRAMDHRSADLSHPPLGHTARPPLALAASCPPSLDRVSAYPVAGGHAGRLANAAVQLAAAAAAVGLAGGASHVGEPGSL